MIVGQHWVWTFGSLGIHGGDATAPAATIEGVIRVVATRFPSLQARIRKLANSNRLALQPLARSRRAGQQFIVARPPEKWMDEK